MVKVSGAARKSILKSVYVSARKDFDRSVQRAKRLHWFNMQTELLNDAENNDLEFWKTIGKVGISQAGDKQIPMEVVLEDGSVDKDWENVLQKWKTDFQFLYNRPVMPRDSNPDDNASMADTDSNAENQILNENITIMKIRKAVYNAKRNKSAGFDEIPPHILRNDNAIAFYTFFSTFQCLFYK